MNTPTMPPKVRWKPYGRGKRPGIRPERGVMNRTETKFLNEVIEPMILAGEAVGWWYEAVTFRLTDTTPDGKPGIRYTPDFLVRLKLGELIFHEVKGAGNATRANLNRVKVAADKFPFRFYVATQQTKKNGGGFKIEEY